MHGDTLRVVASHFAVQLAAVRAIHIGEDVDHVLGRNRRRRIELDDVVVAQFLQRGESIRAAMVFGDLLAGLHVDQIALQQVLAVGGDIAEIVIVFDLVQPGDRRRPHLIFRHAQRLGELLARRFGVIRAYGQRKGEHR